MSHEDQLREQVCVLLKGAFAPNITLLREFDHKKAGIILDGLHFSAWILLGHIRARHQTFLHFMKNPSEVVDLWPSAHWPENHQPRSVEEWNGAIDEYEKELKEMIGIIKDPHISLFEKHSNGKSIFWAATTVLHHTGYHIGQLKAIGRQLGVW